MRRSTLGAPALTPCAKGEIRDAHGACVDDPCSTTVAVKHYAGWAFVGLFGGLIIGQALFKQHPYVSAAAGALGGVAFAARGTIADCGLDTHT
jgi:hypothetical protein